MNQNPTPTMKRIIEWFEEIKDPKIRRRAIRNCDSPEEPATRIMDAIHGGFIWSNTPEGFRYWDAVYENPSCESPDHLLPDGHVEEGESESQLPFQDVIEARIKYFNSKHHTYEGSELQQALNTIRRLVPPIQFKIGVQSFPPIELKNLQNTKK